MAQITEKELSAIGDLLTMEQTLEQKCRYMAKSTTDKVLANCYTQLAQQHQRHFDELFGNLK